jgi:hypothetical protein
MNEKLLEFGYCPCPTPSQWPNSHEMRTISGGNSEGNFDIKKSLS